MKHAAYSAMYRLLFLMVMIGGIFLPTLAAAQNTDSLIAHYSQKAEQYLVHHVSLNSQFSINATGIHMYANADDHSLQAPEFSLYWEELEAFRHMIKKEDAATCLAVYEKKQTAPLKQFYQPGRVKAYVDNLAEDAQPGPLQGYRIAIDPGHFGQTWYEGYREGRSMFIPAGNHPNYDGELRFHESDLAMKTALLLKAKLEKAGASVLFSREPDEGSALGQPFAEWMTDHYKDAVDLLYKIGELNTTERKYWLTKADTAHIMQGLFSKLERRERARKINAFQPHLTVIIHFNVDAQNPDRTKPSERNLAMTFVGGSFMKGELETPEERYHFLRLLVGNDIHYSTLFSGLVMKYYRKELKIEAAGITDESYLEGACKSTAETGVFCRNLYLTRVLHGTLVYGESQYQDNIRESELLGDPDKQEARLKKVANAYYRAVMKYIRKIDD